MTELHQIYQSIRSNYILLYQQDIRGYNPKDLKTLAERLKSGLAIEGNLITLNEQLEKKSFSNKEKKKKQKHLNKAIKQSYRQQFSKTSDKQPQKSKLSLTSQIESQINNSILEQSMILCQKAEEFNFPKIEDEKKGKIYAGKLLVNLDVSTLNTKQKQSVAFNINTMQKQTKISKDIAAKLKLDLNSLRYSLLINGREIDCLLSENQNMIGNGYLIQYGVIVESDYRSTILKFKMVFTQ